MFFPPVRGSQAMILLCLTALPFFNFCFLACGETKEALFLFLFPVRGSKIKNGDEDQIRR